MRTWVEENLELYEKWKEGKRDPWKDTEDRPKREDPSNNNWAETLKKQIVNIIGGEGVQGNGLVLSFDTSGSTRIRQDYGKAIIALQEIFNSGVVSFKKVAFVFWGSSAVVRGPYEFNADTLRSRIFAGIPKDSNGHDGSLGGSSYDQAIAPFLSNCDVKSNVKGELSAFRSKTDLMLVFTDGAVYPPQDSAVRTWIRRMRHNTLYVLDKQGGGYGNASKYIQKFDPTWKQRFVLVTKSKKRYQG